MFTRLSGLGSYRATGLVGNEAVCLPFVSFYTVTRTIFGFLSLQSYFIISHMDGPV